MLPPVRSSPRITKVLESEGTPIYYIVCEQKVFLKANSFSDALYYCFAVYYSFNLEYPRQAHNVLCFFQDCILNYPDSGECTTSYVTIVTDINRFISS